MFKKLTKTIQLFCLISLSFTESSLSSNNEEYLPLDLVPTVLVHLETGDMPNLDERNAALVCKRWHYYINIQVGDRLAAKRFIQNSQPGENNEGAIVGGGNMLDIIRRAEKRGPQNRLNVLPMAFNYYKAAAAWNCTSVTLMQKVSEVYIDLCSCNYRVPVDPIVEYFLTSYRSEETKDQRGDLAALIAKHFPKVSLGFYEQNLETYQQICADHNLQPAKINPVDLLLADVERNDPFEVFSAQRIEDPENGRTYFLSLNDKNPGDKHLQIFYSESK